MSSDVKSFLNSLQELNNANTVTVKIPSIAKKASFKLASVSQQKKLISSAFDGIDGVVKRVNIFNDLITDNSVEDQEYLIIDKPAILLGLRRESVGSKITINDAEYDIDDLPSIKKSDVKLKSTVSHDEIAVDLSVPTLSIDSAINNKLIAELAKITDPSEKLKQSVGMVVSYETSKYIDSIKIGENTVVFSDISSFERKEIVNNLPLKLSNKILDYISSIKKVTDRAVTFDQEVMIEINVSFLSTD